MDATRLAHILDKAPYEASSTVELEAFVTHLLRTNTYDFSIVNALFKNYQVNASSAKIESVCHGLILALMQLPKTDFLSLTYLIPTKLSGHQDIVLLQNCADLLQKGKFGDFWELYVSVPDIFFSSAAGFVDAVRVFILVNLRDTFRSVAKEYFQNSLGLDAESIITYCQSNEFVEKISGDVVIFTLNEHNQNNQSQVNEGLLRMEESLRLVEFLKSQKTN